MTTTYYDSTVTIKRDDVCPLCSKPLPPRGGHPDCTARLLALSYKRAADDYFALIERWLAEEES